MMEFEKCKHCKYLSESIFAGSVENFCMAKGWPTPIDLVSGCEQFEEREFPIWEVVPVGKLYGVAKMHGIEDIERLTVSSDNGEAARNLFARTREDAKMVASALNQEVYARQRDQEIKKEGEK